MTLELFASDSVYRLGRTRNVVVQVWRERGTLDRVEKTRELVAAVHREHPGHVGLLVRVLDGCGLPEPRVTYAFSKFMREVESEVHGIAVVLDGGGFWAASMRALVSSVTLMARSGPPTRVYSELPDACDALTDLLSQHGPALVLPEELIKAVEELGSPALPSRASDCR